MLFFIDFFVSFLTDWFVGGAPGIRIVNGTVSECSQRALIDRIFKGQLGIKVCALVVVLAACLPMVRGPSEIGGALVRHCKARERSVPD